MKTFKTFIAAIIALPAALFLAGCDAAAEKSIAHPTAAAPEGITFSVKNGLSIPPATAQFIGLQITDVAERKIAAVLKFSAQIYRTVGETTFASGNLSPADAQKLTAGQTISIRNQYGAEFSARVTAIQSALEKSSVQTEVLLEISNPNGALTIGASLVATAALGHDQSVVSVPRSALLQTTEGDFVYAVSGEHFVRTAVKLGSQDDAFIEITDGLYAGDQIVVKPVMALWMAELQTLRGGKSCCAGH